LWKTAQIFQQEATILHINRLFAQFKSFSFVQLAVLPWLKNVKFVHFGACFIFEKEV